jgi:cytochrome c-type biogenesis protein CcmE
MKLAMVIVCLAAIATCVVHFRRERTYLRNEVQKYQSQQVTLRRDLWDQQVRLGWLINPAEVRRRTQELALPMVDRAHLPQGPGGSTAGAPPPARGRSSTVHD